MQKKRKVSDKQLEHLRKISGNTKGSKLSIEHKNKISKAHKGKKLSEEQVKKISKYMTGRTGHLSPAWKGGHSKRYKEGYNSVEYKEWRANVFKRDDYTCKHCGKKGCYITAHHIKSWAKYPDLRFNTDNGLTLCEECHKKTDNYKGRNIKGYKHSSDAIEKMRVSSIGKNKKLSDGDVLYVLSNYKQYTHRELAKKFNVAHSTIGAIIRKEREYAKQIE